MAVRRRVYRTIAIPFRLIWCLLLRASVAGLCMMVACFVVFLSVLAYFHAFLSSDLPPTVRHVARDLYARSVLFKAATTTASTCLCFSIVSIWTDRPWQKGWRKRYAGAEPIITWRDFESQSSFNGPLSDLYGSALSR